MQMESKNDETELLSRGGGGGGGRGLSFRGDPTKRIDFILAFHHKHVNATSGRRSYLDNYLNEMVAVGLEYEKDERSPGVVREKGFGNKSVQKEHLESGDEEEDDDANVHYVKIHAPMETLYKVIFSSFLKKVNYQVIDAN